MIRAPDGDARSEQDVVPCLGRLYPAALRMTRNPGDAEDLAWETSARAYATFHQNRPGTSPRNWLHKIRANAFISAYRKAEALAEALAGARETYQVHIDDDVLHIVLTGTGALRPGFARVSVLTTPASRASAAPPRLPGCSIRPTNRSPRTW